MAEEIRLKKEFYKLEKIINKSIDNNDFERAMAGISALGQCYYEWNQFFTNDFLEESIKRIGNKMFPQISYNSCNNVILFYDGFALDTRGLALVYLKALTYMNDYKIIYVTDKSAEGKQPIIAKSVNEKNIEYVYVDLRFSYVEQVEVISALFKKYKPANAFFYTFSQDVAAAIVFGQLKDTIRFLINLTDHAFWLGRNAVDYVLEFRDYGYYVSKVHRKIKPEQMIILPYYPFVDPDILFEGLPFEKKDKKLIFSGGALYKTLSKDNYYYEIVDEILNKHSDVSFLYAGAGDTTRMEELMRKHPQQVFYMDERKDFYGIMKECYLYLNTYPVLGGLMTQYAAVAGKLPITLKNGQLQDGFLINQNNLRIFYNTKTDLLNDVDLLLDNENYYKEKVQRLFDDEYVINPEKFKSELCFVIKNHKSSYEYNEVVVELEQFRKEYDFNFKRRNICNAIISKRNRKLILLFPKLFVEKVIYKFLTK